MLRREQYGVKNMICQVARPHSEIISRLHARKKKRDEIGTINTEREPAATRIIRGSPLGGPLLFSIDTLNSARIIFKDQPCVLKVFQAFTQTTTNVSYAVSLRIAQHSKAARSNAKKLCRPLQKKIKLRRYSDTMNKLVVLVLSVAVVSLAIGVAGCASKTPATNPEGLTTSTGIATNSSAGSSAPTSINGHDYTYYHQLNDPSTCRLCHANM
jgi:hypothetical protein